MRAVLGEAVETAPSTEWPTWDSAPQGGGVNGAPAPGADTLAGLAHELRTPLASLRVTLELLNHLTTLPPEDALGLVRRAQHSVGWLEGLVDNLSTWAAIDAGRVRLDCTISPVLDWVNAAVELVRPFLEARGQQVRVTCARRRPVAYGDSRLLGRVMTNLLTNASAYSVRGDVIDVDISMVDGAVRIQVTDHGPGIPLAEQESIFDRFVRGRAGVGRREGMGLGLHIVKRLAELHGGAVGVRSTPGQGASFWVRLPMLAVGDGAPVQTAVSAPGPQADVLHGDEVPQPALHQKKWRHARRRTAARAARAWVRRRGLEA
jgi:signal transduction histidine kinase